MSAAKCPKRSRTSCLAWVLAGFVVLVASSLFAYRPDRPVATIAPGSSSGPAFVVQIIRPRAGLPLGGLLPPDLFGIDANLRFDSKSPGAEVVRADAARVELAADGWELVLAFDANGRLDPAATHVQFELLFEEEPRTVRCRPGDGLVGTVSTTLLQPGELSGSFDIELPHCDDATTGEPLGWPPQPFVLHGSFDRLTSESAGGR